MSDFQIEKNVPLPARTRKAGPSKYPWQSLEVGDSFAIDGEKVPTNQSLISGAKRFGIKVRVAKVEEDGEERTRVWRVE